MSDGIYSSRATAAANVAGLIRANNSGMCSGEPAGVRYPDVPSVEDVLDALGLAPDAEMSEDDWLRACDVVLPEPEPPAWKIEARDRNGHWDAACVASEESANWFSSEAEALEAIESLRALGDEWATAEYRVVRAN